MTGVPIGRGSPWRRLMVAYHRLLSALLIVSVAILVIPVALQIFSRFTHLIPHYIWTEEMARFLFIWTIMIGAMIGVRERSHFEVDLWPRLGPKAEAGVRLLVSSPCSPSPWCSSGPGSNSRASPGSASPNSPSFRSG